jgi:transposase-like protein
MVRRSAKGEIPLEVRRQHVDQWQRSDLSKESYCQQHGIELNQLSYWQKALQRKQLPALRAGSPFARIVTEAGAGSATEKVAAAARLIVGDAAVEIGGAADPVWAGRLIAAAGGLRR